MALHFLYGTFGKNAFLLPERVEVNGSIEAALPGQVDGYVSGDVRTTGKLVIGKKARIQGNVYAGDLVSYGRIDGDVFVNGKAVLSGKARVKGDITATVLDIQGEAVVDGTIHKNIHSDIPDAAEDTGLGGNAAEASAEPAVLSGRSPEPAVLPGQGGSAGPEASSGRSIKPGAPSGRSVQPGALSGQTAGPSAGESSIREEEKQATSWF